MAKRELPDFRWDWERGRLPGAPPLRPGDRGMVVYPDGTVTFPDGRTERMTPRIQMLLDYYGEGPFAPKGDVPVSSREIPQEFISTHDPVPGRISSHSIITRQSSREAIRELQRSLAALDFDVGRIDGVLGRKTQAAIVAFQRANGLPDDGKAGPQTQRTLYSGTAEGRSRVPRPRPDFPAVRPAGPPGAFPAALRDIPSMVRPAGPAGAFPAATRAAPRVFPGKAADDRVNPTLPRAINPQARGGPVGVPQMPRMTRADVTREISTQRARSPEAMGRAPMGGAQMTGQQIAEKKATILQQSIDWMSKHPESAPSVMAQLAKAGLVPPQSGPLKAAPKAATSYTYAPTRNEQMAAQLRKDIRAGDLASQSAGMSQLLSKPAAPQETIGTYSPPAASTLSKIPGSGNTLSVSLNEFLQKGKDLLHIDGMNPTFSSNLERMFRDAPPDIRRGIKIYSGYRTYEHQERLWKDALKKYGSPEAARKWVAPPGHSFHGKRLAADLEWNGTRLDKVPKDVKKWMHDNAAKYGLHFPVGNEPWHIEQIGSRGGRITSQPGSVVQKGSNPEAITALQSSLSKAGFDPGGIDGKYGANTEAAIRAFQDFSGLVVDGKAGPDTQKALLTVAGTRGAMAYGNNNYALNSVLAKSSPDPWAAIASSMQLPTDPRVNMKPGSFPAHAISSLAKSAYPIDPRVGMAPGSLPAAASKQMSRASLDQQLAAQSPGSLPAALQEKVNRAQAQRHGVNLNTPQSSPPAKTAATGNTYSSVTGTPGGGMGGGGWGGNTPSMPAVDSEMQRQMARMGLPSSAQTPKSMLSPQSLAPTVHKGATLVPTTLLSGANAPKQWAPGVAHNLSYIKPYAPPISANTGGPKPMSPPTWPTAAQEQSLTAPKVSGITPKITPTTYSYPPPKSNIDETLAMGKASPPLKPLINPSLSLQSTWNVLPKAVAKGPPLTGLAGATVLGGSSAFGKFNPKPVQTVPVVPMVVPQPPPPPVKAKPPVQATPKPAPALLSGWGQTLKDFGKSAIEQAVKTWMTAGPVQSAMITAKGQPPGAAFAALANLPHGPTAEAQLSYLIAKNMDLSAFNASLMAASGGSSGNYSGGGMGNYGPYSGTGGGASYGGPPGSYYSGPSSGGYTKKSGGA